MATHSQGEVASQGSQGGPLLLDLAKYSYATLPMNSVGPVPWIHISNTASLVALFETRRSLGGQGDVQEKSIFKVLKDPEIMEQLDLQALARESQLAVERSDDAVQHSKDQNVAVITRAPVIAIKYPLNEREVRRFQIRFQTDEQYYEAMKLFSRAGVRPVEAGTFPSRPRTTVSNDSTTAVAPAAQCQSLSSRPATAVSYSTVVSAPAAVQRPSTCSSSLMPPPSHFSAPPGAGEHNAASSVSGPLQRTVNGFTPDSYRALGPGPVAPSVDGKSSSTPCIGETVSLLDQGKSTIEPYVPRPSTVPDAHSQHLSQILPPKRDLPFEKKTDISRAPLKELRSRKRPSAEPAISADSGKTDRDNVPVDVQAEPQGSPQSTSKRRQPPARASSARSSTSKKARTTRKKVNKPSPKAAAMPKQADLSVPSIEDHLHPVETGVPQNSMLEETQALLERAAARLQRRSTRSSTAQGVHDPSKGLTSALDPTVSCSTATAVPENAGSKALDDMAMAYSELMQQAEFANSGDKLEGWANGQSTDVQKSAIDKFICDAYQDRRFWNLWY
ncbi:hypothetical protein DV735_g5134, partial [Chaetothyriales sp. CBS 134920]